MKHYGDDTLDVPSGAFKLNHSRIGTSVSTDKYNFMKVTSSKDEVIKLTWHKRHRCWRRS